jgi:Prion-inhibition and propagation
MTTVGGVSLAIQVTELAYKSLVFVQRVVKYSKAFGSDVQSLRTQIATEAARLQAFSAFLKHKSPSGETQFDQLPDLTKRAVLGNVQELGILFAQYTTVVAKYGVEELMRGYGVDLAPGSQTGIFGAVFAEEGVAESSGIQREARAADVAAWGLFKRKNVVELADKLALWNDRLMKLLLCGLCFGKNFSPWQSDDTIARENL